MKISETTSLKALLAKPFANRIQVKMQKWMAKPLKTQNAVFQNLIKQASSTRFGKDHEFDTIKTHADFVKKVPVRDYEALKPYVELIIHGEKNILWKGRPLYFAKTSGTTSGAKYIPITDVSIKAQVQASRNAILCYINETGNTKFVDGKMIFLQGSPMLEKKKGIKFGRLSGISAHYIPRYLQKNRLPSWDTNCIEDWETKVEAIINETIEENMTIIAGIPSWVQMYFEKIHQHTGKTISEVFKNFNLFIYGGVNFEPYRSKFEKLIGKKVDSIEFYPASEGFFAFQNKQKDKGMLLLLDSGIFYEFIKAEDFFNDNAARITLKDVVLGVNYVMIISTNAGLWAYNVGDTVEFTSINPFKIIVTGRIKHFISAFGEHVISKEVELAMREVTEIYNFGITEFSVAPQLNPENGLPFHEWFIEFEEFPDNIKEIETFLDKSMQDQNSYYFDLVAGKVLQPLKIRVVIKNGFNDYMRHIGKLGGQNKIPKLSNDRSIADFLMSVITAN